MTRRLAIEDLAPASQEEATTLPPPPAEPVDPAEALIGRVVAGRYRVAKVLGRGGMGVVLEGEHLELQKTVAIKVLLASYARDAEALARFEREARTAAKLGHANIVGTLDLGRLDTGEPFLVMEHLAGQDMVEVVRAAGRNELAPARMLRILEQVAAALDAIHQAGIVHRDIKAENVLLVPGPGGTEIAKVVDFGLATLADAERRGARLTREGMVIGTPEYMAPECVRGALGGPAADRYALAVLAFEMLCGYPPFEAPVPMEILLAKLAGDAPLLSTVSGRPSPAVDRVLARALSRDPDARHASCAELVEALRAALDEDRRSLSTRAEQEGSTTLPLRPLPYRAIAVVAAALALLGAALVGWRMLPAASDAVAPAPTTPVIAAPEPPPLAPTPVVATPAVEPEAAAAIAAAVPATAGSSRARAATRTTTESGPGAAPHATPQAPSPATASPTSQPTAQPTPQPTPSTTPEPTPRASATEPVSPAPAAATAGRAGAGSRAEVAQDGPSAAELVRSAQSALLRGQVGQARDLFRDATRVAPRHAPAWRGLGIASEQLHEAPEARRAFERYLELSPDAPDAAAVRGRLARLGG